MASLSFAVRRAGLALACAGLLLDAAPARAGCCVFEDPLLAIGDVAARSGTWRLALESEALASRSAMPMAPGEPAMDERVRLFTLRAVVVHSPLERLNIVASIPFVRRDWSLAIGDMPGGSATLTGIGDVDLGARWAVWRQVRFEPDDERIAVTRVQALAVFLGSGLPTGDASAMQGGMRLPEHAQIGTGAWAPYAGLAYQHQREPWAFSASATARVRTTNRYGYRFGPALLGGADLRRDITARVSVSVGVDLRWASPDRQDGAAVGSTGGALVSLAPSSSVALGGGARLHVRAALPVVQALRGDQRVYPGVVAGLSWDVH